MEATGGKRKPPGKRKAAGANKAKVDGGDKKNKPTGEIKTNAADNNKNESRMDPSQKDGENESCRGPSQENRRTAAWAKPNPGAQKKPLQGGTQLRSIKKEGMSFFAPNRWNYVTLE